MKSLLTLFCLLSLSVLAEVPQSGLVAYWALNDVTGLTNVYGGPFLNGTAYNGLIVGGTNDVYWRSNSATFCNPIGTTFCSLPRTATASWSLAFWFKTAGYSPAGLTYIVGQPGDNGSLGYHNDGFTSNPWLHVYWAGSWHILTNITWTPTNWNHLAVTYDSGDTVANYYFNGTLLAQTNGYLPGTLYMSARNAAGDYHGACSFSAVSLYHRAISAAEVQQLYFDTQGVLIFAGRKRLDFKTASASICDLSVILGTNTDTLLVSWTNNLDTVGAFIQRGTTSDPVSSYPIGFSNGTNFLDTTARYGNTYYYWIIGTDGTALSGFCNPPASGSISLLGPTNVVATTNLPSSINVTWTNPTNAVGSQLWRNTNDVSGTATLIADPATSPFVDTQVASDQTYFYWVKATNSHGVGLFSSPSAMGSLTNTGPALTVTGPSDWNFFSLSWSNFAPGQQYFVVMKQQGKIRDYIQDLGLGETNCEVNNAFWDSSGVRIDHTNDWPIFWVSTADGSQRSQSVQPHWPLVTPPDTTIANCNATTLKVLAPTFPYMPTSHRNSPYLQSSDRYYEVSTRVIYDLGSGTPYTPVTMSSPDTNVIFRFTADDGTSPTIATTNPSYDGANGAGAARLTPVGLVPAFWGGIKARAFETNGSGYISPEVTLIVDRKLTSLAQGEAHGVIGGPYTIGTGIPSSQTAISAYVVAHYIERNCVHWKVTDYFSSHYGSVFGSMVRDCESHIVAGGTVVNLGTLLLSDVVTVSNDGYIDPGLCGYFGPPNHGYPTTIDTVSTTVHSMSKATMLTYSSPVSFANVSPNIATGVWLAVQNSSSACGKPFRAAYWGAPNLVGPSGSSAGLVSSAQWMLGVTCPGGWYFTVPYRPQDGGVLGHNESSYIATSEWVICDVQFTLCDDSHVYGEIQ